MCVPVPVVNIDAIVISGMYCTSNVNNDIFVKWNFYLCITTHVQRPRNAVIHKLYERVIPNNQWWRHDMEMLSALLAFCKENPTVTDGSPH